MAKKFPKEAIRQRTVTIFGVIVLGYFLLGSGKLIFENYRINQNSKQLESDIAALEQRNLELKSLLAYYRTDSYKEKEARERLNYKKPGERLVIVPLLPGEVEVPTITEPSIETRSPTPPSNPKQWYDYFFSKRS